MREFDGHEVVVFSHDANTGLRAIVAVHSTALGPAAGGCRMWPYASTTAAVVDVLRLSRGMSYKNAMASLPFGGGKAVIIGEARKAKTPELFEAFGRFVDSLGGRYVTAEDVGTTMADMASVARVTRHVAGLGRAPGEAGGDPGPKTALGVCLGIKAAVRFRLGRQDLQDLTVAVQGAGGVGYHLCGLLAAARAHHRRSCEQPAGAGTGWPVAAGGRDPVRAGLRDQCRRHHQRFARVSRRRHRRAGHGRYPGDSHAADGDLRTRPARESHDERGGGPDGARAPGPAPAGASHGAASASGAGTAVKYTVAHEAG